MSFKRSTTSMAIALMALSLISMASVQQDAFAQSLGMEITAIADKGSNTITITGKTVSDITDVTLKVTSPSGSNVVLIDQLTPDANGEFMVDLKVGDTWKEDGFYEIEVMQGVHANSLYTLHVFVEVNGGMAERTSETESTLQTGLLGSTGTVAKYAGLVLDEIIINYGTTMFEVTGTTDKVSESITLTVTAPNGNKISVDQVAAALDGEFAAEISVGLPAWKQDGFYTVTAHQNEKPNYSDSKQVDILDGVVVPEFGTIAAMILAVAIISIIAISARSRLSIIPRY